MQKGKIIYPELSFQINGILFKVRKDLGRFKSEKQYCDAIEGELRNLNSGVEEEE